MKIHIINLKEADRRREFMIMQLNKLGLQYEIFDAVKGSSLSEEELSAKVDMNEVAKYPHWLTRNMLGASLSHMGVYQNIVNSNEDWHLILEDDVELSNDVLLLLNHIRESEHIYRDHLVLLYAVSYKGAIELVNNPITRTGSYNIYRVVSNEIGGGGAYVLHRSAAKKLIEKNRIIKVAPDTWHFFLSQGTFSQIDCVCPFAAKPGLFESTIGYVDPKSLRYKIKHFIERYRIPGLYYVLRQNRKKIWEKTSNIIFKQQDA